MKKFKNYCIIFIILYIIKEIIINVSDVHDLVFFSYKIFIENIVPNLFPFLILSNFLINYGFVDICFKIFNPFMKKIFKIDGVSSFVFIMSLITGFPSNSKYTKDLLKSKKINSTSATKILTFTHFSNPLFVIGTISSFINMRVSLIILLSHYIGNIIVGIIFRNHYLSDNSKSIVNNVEYPFGTVLLNSVRTTIDTLLLIYGTMTFFLIISNIICNIFTISPILKCIVSGIMEFTQGLKYASVLMLNIKYKAVLMGMFISFGGICVHAQILSIISDTEISYKPFFIARIIHSIITGVIIYLII